MLRVLVAAAPAAARGASARWEAEGARAAVDGQPVILWCRGGPCLGV